MTDESNGRTHEPSLRELTSDLDGLRDLVLSRIEGLKDVLRERDEKYTERDASRKTAVDAALSAVKDQTKASFDASEKAIVKAEDAQRAYNTAHNDLARKMDEQNKATMPRTETENRFRTLEEKIAELRNGLAIGGGMAQGGQAMKDETRANLAILLSFIGLLIAAGLALFRRGS